MRPSSIRGSDISLQGGLPISPHSEDSTYPKPSVLTTPNVEGESSMTPDDLFHLALLSVTEGCEGVLIKARFDRPDEFSFKQWVVESWVPEPGEIYEALGCPSSASELEAVLKGLRWIHGSLREYAGIIKGLASVDYEGVTWGAMVEAGMTFQQASRFMLQAVPGCDHVVVDGVMMEWVERMTSDMMRPVKSCDLRDQGNYVSMERTCRRIQKIYYPFATSRVADEIIRGE